MSEKKIEKKYKQTSNEFGFWNEELSFLELHKLPSQVADTNAVTTVFVN